MYTTLSNTDDSLGLLSPKASAKLQSEVFTMMHKDELSKTAQNDPLIAMRDSKFANNKLCRKYYPSFLVRLVARLLLFREKKIQKRAIVGRLCRIS